ncbi:MAG: hypothetical protein LWY06_20605 [Firmicutes bacterium]|nr:hypothetical protein [Bacillota bacterium]
MIDQVNPCLNSWALPLPDNPVFMVFFIEHGQLLLQDFSGEPARKFEF